MRFLKFGLPICLVAFTCAISASGPASARVVCEKGYRIIKGNRLGTPYCQDLYLVAVAREFGVRVSADEILNNPSKKREVCRFIGWDIRIQYICDSALPKRGPF